MQDYERYITVQEAAKRLGRPEPEILRMLETGALPAMLRAELASKDGTPIGFDFARLPPEGVARVVDQGGDDFTLEWQYCGGHGKAVCFPARESSIRVLWEPSLFPELMPQSEDAHPAATPTHGELLAPVAKVGADVEAGNPSAWIVTQPKRDREYSMPLYRLLLAAHLKGKPRPPTAREVVEEWRLNTPPEIAKILPDGFDYYDATGNTKTASLVSIRKRIERLTSAR